MYKVLRVVDFDNYQCVIRENEVYNVKTLRSIVDNKYFIHSDNCAEDIKECNLIKDICKDIVATGQTFTFITIEDQTTKDRLRVIEVAMTKSNDVVWLRGDYWLVSLLDNYLRKNTLRLNNAKGTKGGKTATKLLGLLESFFK